MNTYEVTIVETLSKTIRLQAEDVSAACNQIKQKYEECNIILDSGNINGVTYSAKIVNDYKYGFRPYKGRFEIYDRTTGKLYPPLADMAFDKDTAYEKICELNGWNKNK